MTPEGHEALVQKLVCSAMKSPSSVVKTWWPASLILYITEVTWPHQLDVHMLVLLRVLERACAYVVYAASGSKNA